MKKIETIQHPPRINLETELMRRFEDENERAALRAWHASLVVLSHHGYLSPEYFDSVDQDCFVAWSLYVGVSFWDTQPTYTMAVDGEPLTMADLFAQRDRVAQATKHLRETDVS